MRWEPIEGCGHEDLGTDQTPAGGVALAGLLGLGFSLVAQAASTRVLATGTYYGHASFVGQGTGQRASGHLIFQGTVTLAVFEQSGPNERGHFDANLQIHWTGGQISHVEPFPNDNCTYTTNQNDTVVDPKVLGSAAGEVAYVPNRPYIANLILPGYNVTRRNDPAGPNKYFESGMSVTLTCPSNTGPGPMSVQDDVMFNFGSIPTTRVNLSGIPGATWHLHGPQYAPGVLTISFPKNRK